MSGPTRSIPPFRGTVFRCVLAAAIAICLSSCSSPEDHADASSEQAVAPSSKLATRAQLAGKPAILRSTQSVDPDLPALLARVPGEVRRPIAQIRKIPNPTSSRRYWLTPWQGPKGDFGFSCLYAISPGEQGIGTSCYSDRQLESGRAVSFAFVDERLEFIGFNPDPRGHVTLQFADHSTPVPVRNGVFVGSTEKFPRSIRVTSDGRMFTHSVPPQLKDASGR